MRTSRRAARAWSMPPPRGWGSIIMEPLRGGGLTARIPDEVQAVWDKSRVKRIASGMGAAVCLEPARSERRAQRHERAGADGGEYKNRQPGIGQFTYRRELALIQEAKAFYQARTRVNCTSCGYCMPCPTGVNIPANFLQLNNLAIYRDRAAADFFYFNILKEDERASHCEECGQCEERVSPAHPGSGDVERSGARIRECMS